MNSHVVFLLNLLSTWYMVGLIWMVQIVHYNLFDRVGTEGFADYERDHSRLITPIVALPMLVELGTACALVVAAPPGFSRTAAILGLVAVGLIWLSTAFLQVPYHGKLSLGFDQSAYRGLVATNWIRTMLWTARGVLLAYFAAKMLGRS
ncbi:hypothetical protein Pla22_51830 [Rubripirellula amarantea]|uniref:DUF1772 domain-containing protein n=1 Tax=Rubripirellula amarantea TaxID=2527999 RepID=A0A5C5WEL2_9BACT|nr:hypothetical protein [Rubripirellula amarantea]TWT48182.1 hypothetical protein Pla22_51830 [Rubripirellula amarantea]